MTEKLEIYKCNVCGNIIQVLINGVGELVCCNQAMNLLTARVESDNELAEKHTPAIDISEEGKFVRLKHHLQCLRRGFYLHRRYQLKFLS